MIEEAIITLAEDDLYEPLPQWATDLLDQIGSAGWAAGAEEWAALRCMRMIETYARTER